MVSTGLMALMRTTVQCHAMSITGTGLVIGQRLQGYVNGKLYEVTITKQDYDRGYVMFPPEQENSSLYEITAQYTGQPYKQPHSDESYLTSTNVPRHN